MTRIIAYLKTRILGRDRRGRGRLDLLSVSAAFDGRLSHLEKHHLPEAFMELTDLYMRRTLQLTSMLVSGQLHAAKELCTLDFNPG